MSGAPSGGGEHPRWVFVPFLAAVVAIVMAVGIRELDRAFPPPLEFAEPVSAQVLDRGGNLLRAFATPAGRWRLRATLEDLDPRYVRMLLAYEDRRFSYHPGVDPIAMLRAAGQFLRHGRIVSGGSTITMQLARLLEGPSPRSLAGKFKQCLRALQIEARLGKREILELYLTLAPYGGNLEGVVAASHAYLGKPPRKLSPAESALLVALPQSPEVRRPDRSAEAALNARNRVFDRMTKLQVIDRIEIEAARREPVRSARYDLPSLAGHLAQEALRVKTDAEVHRLTVDREIQARLEEIARNHARLLGDKLSVAMMLADSRSGEVLAHVGSPSVFDSTRRGEIDMAQAPRSPGSTLKPFIYGLAFEEGLILPETLIEDRPQDFSGYRPSNFDQSFQGTVTVREALQQSLNIPAVRLLDAVGPQRLMARLRRAGVEVELPVDGPVGLAIGLGGLGVSLRDLVGLYAALPNLGTPVRLTDGLDRSGTRDPASGRVLSPVAAWYANDILLGTPPPDQSRRIGIAYKTGTSYGYRDAWAIGYDGRLVLGVWVGRPDGTAIPGLSGRSAAAPILFEAFERLPSARTGLPKPPQGVLRLAAAQLPASLKRFAPPGKLIAIAPQHVRAPSIVHPPDGARIDLGMGLGEEAMPLTVKLEGGKAPFRWLANGRPFPRPERRRSTLWVPDGPGSSTLTVIDADGRAASVTIYVQ